MDTAIIFSLHGLVYGMMLFLVASGITLVFGMMNVLNMAHGAFYMLGAYFSYQIVMSTGNFWLALIVCPIIVGALGIMLERFILRKAHSGGHVRELVVTYGVLYILTESVKWIWGDQPLSMSTPESLSGSFTILGHVYPAYRLFIVVFASAVLLMLMLVLLKTRLGRVVRAAVCDREMVSALGVNTEVVFMLVMGLGSWLAGVGGVIAGPFLSTYPAMGAEVMVDCFVVTVTGGLGSLGGAAIASLLIGEFSSFGILWMPRFSIVISFLIMAVVLIVKPSGLFGEKA